MLKILLSVLFISILAYFIRKKQKQILEEYDPDSLQGDEKWC